MSGGASPACPIGIRPRAVEDIERHASYLEENAAPDVASRFRRAIMDALDQIAFMPQAGAPRDVGNTRLTGLRMFVVRDFRKYLVFYVSPDGYVDIVRILHGTQDVMSILEDEE